MLFALRVMLSRRIGEALESVNAPLTVTAGNVPEVPVIDPPVSVVEPEKVKPAPLARLNAPELVLVPESVSVPTFPFTVPPLLNSTLMLPPVGAP